MKLHIDVQINIDAPALHVESNEEDIKDYISSHAGEIFDAFRFDDIHWETTKGIIDEIGVNMSKGVN